MRTGFLRERIIGHSPRMRQPLFRQTQTYILEWSRRNIRNKPSPESPHPRKHGGQMSKKNGLADPTRLKPFDSDDQQKLRVVIETPKGSRNKFAFNPEEHVFELKKVLPSGMAFPYDFGFVPSTEADDGDPVDVLVLMDEPAFPGCVLTCRPIGVVEGGRGGKKDKERKRR